jgi:hypothetical protein
MSDGREWELSQYIDKIVGEDEVNVAEYSYDGAKEKLAVLETSGSTSALDEIYSIADKSDSLKDDTAKETAREFGWTTEKQVTQKFEWTFDAYKDFSDGVIHVSHKTDPVVAIEFERGNQVKHRWLWMKFAVYNHKREFRGEDYLQAGVIFIPLGGTRTSFDRCAKELKSGEMPSILSPYLPPLYIIGV